MSNLANNKFVKYSYIRKISNGEYSVFFNGNDVGSFSTRDGAIEKLRSISFVKTAATETIDLTDIDSFSYSGVSREIRHNCKPDTLFKFQTIYKSLFDKEIFSLGKESDEELKVILVSALKQLDDDCKIIFPASEDKSEADAVGPVERFSEVVPGLFRGAAPSIKDIAVLKKEFGIKKIISLDYKAGQKIDRACKALGIEHIMFPIEIKRFKAILKIPSMDIKKLFLEGGPTFVHCLHGKDRTGMMVALFRTQTGWTAERAIAEADKFDFCKGLSPKVRSFFESIIRGDDNALLDIPMNADSLQDSLLNTDYNPSFAVPMYFDSAENFPYADKSYNNSNYDNDSFYTRNEVGDNNPEYISDDLQSAFPEVGDVDTYTMLNGYGPSGGIGVGTGV